MQVSYKERLKIFKLKLEMIMDIFMFVMVIFLIVGVCISLVKGKNKTINELNDYKEVLLQHNQSLRTVIDGNNKMVADKRNEILDMQTELMKVESLFDEEKEKYDKLIHQKKSSEVRVGLIGEQLAPFLKDWPFDDTKNFKFLGSPIDGISFEKDELVLVEIKTGNSKLSSKQKEIKNQIKEGKVRFVEFRIGEDGCKSIEN